MEGRSKSLLALAIVFMVVTAITVSIRMHVRARVIKAVGSDDWVMLAAFVFFLAYLICQIGGIRHGTGQHLSTLPRGDAEIALQYWFLCEIFYTLATGLLKVSVGLFLLRVTVEPTHVLAIRMTLVATLTLGSFYALLGIFQCKPVSFWWDLDPNHTGHCIDPAAFTIVSYVLSGFNSLADLIFAILPFLMVRHAAMTTKTRVVVFAILSIASIACFATLVRMPYLHTLERYKGDFLWSTTEVAMLSTIEVGLGMTAACVATFRPLVESWLNPDSEGWHRRETSRRTPALGSLNLFTIFNDAKGTADTRTRVVAVFKGDSQSQMPDLLPKTTEHQPSSEHVEHV